MTSFFNTNRQAQGMITIIAIMLVFGFAAQAYAQCDPIQRAKLFTFNGQNGDTYGNSVSINGTTAVVGAQRDADNGMNAGAAYVYEFIDGEWLETAKLTAFDGAPMALFGISVSVDGDFIVIGAPSVFDPLSAGAAYVFTKFLGFWVQLAKLEIADGPNGNAYGFSVSISGDFIIVGAPGSDNHDNGSGAVYVYRVNEFLWTQEARLVPLDGQPGDQFGAAVSLANGVAVIGARGDNDNGNRSGSAYIYARQAVEGEWVQRAKLLASDGQPRDWFGSVVDTGIAPGNPAGSNTVVVGALNNNPTPAGSGAAYIYTTNDNGITWAEDARFLPSNGAAGQDFGYVATNGETVIVGAPNANTTAGIRSGAAYVYTRAGGSWVQRTRILPTAGDDSFFGAFPQIDNDTVIIGAPLDNIIGTPYIGAAYIVDINCPPCLADITGDGMLNFFDVSEYLAAYALNEPIADMNNDGFFNFFDVSAFLAEFAAGC